MDCLICCEEQELFVLGKCNHCNICIECSFKIRLLNNNINCTVCKEELINVIIVENINENFNKININNLNEYKNSIYFRDKKVEEMCKKYILIKCPLNCKKKLIFIDEIQLKKHLKQDHQRYFCDLCVKNRSMLISEHKLYRKNELEFHQKEGDYDNEGNLEFIHPYCVFCKKLFYNEDLFLNHLKQNHYVCNICEKTEDFKYYYYKDYPNLNKHFEKSHFICPFDECINKLFIVFSQSKELQNHLLLNHNNKPNKNLINFEKEEKEKKFVLKDNEGIDISKNLLSVIKNQKLKENSEFNDSIQFREIILYSKEQSVLNLEREEEINILNNKNNKKKLFLEFNNFLFADYYKIPFFQPHSLLYKEEFMEKIQLILKLDEENQLVDSINKFYKKKIKPYQLFDQFYNIFGEILVFKYFYYFIKTIKILKLALILDNIWTKELNKLLFKNKCLLNKHKNYSYLFNDIYNKLCEVFFFKIKNKFIDTKKPFILNKERLFQWVSGINHWSLNEISKFKLLNNFLKNSKTKNILYESLFVEIKNINNLYQTINHFDLHILIIYLKISILKLKKKSVKFDSNLNQNITKMILRHFPQFCYEINYNFESEEEDNIIINTNNYHENEEDQKKFTNKTNLKNVNFEKYKETNILENKFDSMEYKINDKYDFPTLEKSISHKIEKKNNNDTHWGDKNSLNYKNKNTKILDQDFPELGKKKVVEKKIDENLKIYNPLGNEIKKTDNDDIMIKKVVKKKKRRK